MRSTRRNWKQGLGWALLGGGLAAALLGRLALAQAQQQEEPPPYYQDDQIFEQLSGAGQSLLERRYGRKQPGPAVTGGPGEGPLGPLSAVDNIPVNNPGADGSDQDTQSETALVLAGTRLVAAWNDSGSLLPGGDQFTGYGYSDSGGASWSDGGALPAGPLGDGGDPVLAHDRTAGRTYLSTLQEVGSGLALFRSNDGATSWLPAVQGGPGFGGDDFLDKPWLTVDNFNGPGQGNVYLMFRNFAGGGAGSQPDGLYLTRSGDGGASFGPAGGTLVNSGGQGSFVLVGPDHTVYAFWWQGGTPRTIQLSKSSDQGQSFGPAVTVARLNGAGVNGDLGLGGGFRTNSFPHAAVHPTSGQLYVVFNDDPPGADRADVFLTTSSDGGGSWSPPARVNDDAGSNDQYMPTLAVTQDGARLAVSFYDRRLDSANSLIDYYGAVGQISGGTVAFGPNFRLTTASFPVVIGVDPGVNPTYMGDYDMMAADNDFFYVAWGDNRDQSLALPNRKNANVRFGKFPVNGPGAILTLASVELDAACGNGNGVIDFNECNQLNLAMKNVGSGPATGVSALLSSGAPEVKLTQPSSAYAQIEPGQTMTNTIPFAFNTPPGLGAGTTLAFNLVATTAGDGLFNFPFELTAGQAGPALRFDQNSPLPLADPGPVTSTLTVAGVTAPAAEVIVSLYLTHPLDSELDIFIVAPDGGQVALSRGNGAAGSDYGAGCSPDSSRTRFDDGAATPISAGAAPFVGVFRPDEALATFRGQAGAALNGNWSLRVEDNSGGNGGVLQCWSLLIAPFEASDGGGPCLVDLALSQQARPDPVQIGTPLAYTISLSNPGPVPAGPITVTDVLPAGLLFQGASGPGWSCGQSGGMVTCTAANLAVGSGPALTIQTLAPLTVGLIANQATLSSSTPDMNLLNNSQVITTQVILRMLYLPVMMKE